MKKEIIINATANEIRIAITEEKRLAELYVETPEKERMVGDIYLGKVAKVMPGIRAAFIDIGLKQDAFLHFSDIGTSLSDYSSLFGDDDSDVDVDDDGDDEEVATVGVEQQSASAGQPRIEPPPAPPRFNRNQSYQQGRDRDNGRSQSPIPDLKAGQDIIVQVTKEPVGKKGVRVTSEVSLPGRFLVLLPFDGKIGVSKKMNNFREKRRLRRIVRSILPEGFGVIIRTVAQDRDEAALRQDLEGLIATWREIEKSVKTEQAPALLYKDMATTSSVIRDLFTDSVERVVVDSRKLYKEIRAYVKLNSPQLVEKIELHKDREPVFDTFGVEKEIATALSRKVWLKSGGYIIIDQTEAMAVIDVNSGRYAAKREQELNSLRTNLEASREICRQLRLRDIGGIIVIDFIDLEDERNKKKVYDEIRKEFRKDRAKVTVLPMTDIGLVQITRQRIRQNILHSFSEPCPVCGGGGMVQSKSSIVNQIERWIRRFKSETKEFKLTLRVHPSIGAYLKEGTIGRLTKFKFKYFVAIKLEEDPKLPLAEFHFISRKHSKDITDQFRS
ncbi:MAG: Rne/Rng family ribonuclease [Ignavibacteriae bacterium]|nr:Rne/Rng family ribonuclease [Ignavibacteria bacterium]MBI3365254.1 Rne/Rng family ribonuclease [Ignavibacteriota bacterium]